MGKSNDKKKQNKKQISQAMLEHTKVIQKQPVMPTEETLDREEASRKKEIELSAIALKLDEREKAIEIERMGLAERRAEIENGRFEEYTQLKLSEEKCNFDREFRAYCDEKKRELIEILAKEREKELAQCRVNCEKLKESDYKQLEQRANDLDQREAVLSANEDKLQQAEAVQKRYNVLETRNKFLLGECEHLESKYNQIQDKLKSAEIYKDKADELLKSLHEIERENIDNECLSKRYEGVELQSLQQTIDGQEKAIMRLQSELKNRPSLEDGVAYDELKRAYGALTRRTEEVNDANQKLSSQYESFSQLENEKIRLEIDNAALSNQVKLLGTTIDTYTECIEHTQNKKKEVAVAMREECMRTIRIPYRTFADGHYEAPLGIGQKHDMFESEHAWLCTVYDRCVAYGIVFPKRILYAFHTALKISDWSSLAVLAGVSGTGKSELPRLYSAFGGITFINVAVQPNWDSQESMLGFFNSIDNTFDAQPLLQFLAQCTTTKVSDENGLGEYMSIVLLDEMNLAHVEHYFAEFLSKLEERRGKSKKTLPTIPIKLGAGMDPYQVPLSRNVLWAGTMNQDETTKTLSDKVLDRGIVIHFPRPTELISRREMKEIQELPDVELLKYKTWTSWLKRELVFRYTTDAEENDVLYEWQKQGGIVMQKFKSILEDINSYLSVVNGAIGHRVWQSVEYYIENYPTVCHLLADPEDVDFLVVKQEMYKAFEDQLVQKVMPKLRGIDTKGASRTECLNKIRDLLKRQGFHLDEDFEHACKFGYGQFTWCSALYLSDEEVYEEDEDEDDIVYVDAYDEDDDEDDEDYDDDDDDDDDDYDDDDYDDDDDDYDDDDYDDYDDDDE